MVATLEVLLKLRDDFSADLRRHRRDLTTFGRDLAMIGGAGVAGFGLAIKGAIDFESSFAGVRKTVDASEAEFDALQEQFREMARQIPINVNEINRIGEAAGQLGIKKENLAEFTRVMADLGATTNLTSDEAATSLARLANITQMPQSEFGRLGATVVDLGNKMASTESEIVDMGLRLAGAGKQIGLTEAEVLGFAGALSSVGIAAEAGGTAISRVMVDIARAVDQGGDKLDGFAQVAGMSAEDFRRAFQDDAAGAIVTFIEGLGRVKDEGGNTFQVLEDLGQGNVRVRDALLRSAGAGDLLREALQTGSAAWEENTALTEEAEKRYATTASQIQILKNNVNDVAIEVGQQLMPALNDSVVVLGDAIDLWRGLPQPVQETAVRLGAATSGIALFSGGLLIALPKMAEATASFGKLWRASMLFRGSLVGGVGLIAGLTLLPPLLSAIKGKSVAPTMEQMAASTDTLARSLAGLEDKDLILGRISAELREVAELQLVSWSSIGQADIVAMIQKLDELGVSYPAVMRMMEQSGVAMSGEVRKALDGLEQKYENHTLEMEVWRLKNMVAWTGAEQAASGGAAGISASLDRITASLQSFAGAQSDNMNLLAGITGVRTQEANAIDLQINALEQESVAAEMATLGQQGYGGATANASDAIDRQIGSLNRLAAAAVSQSLRDETMALERELTVLELGKIKIEAQINARNRLATAQLAMARVLSLPDMLKQKQLELDREKILQRVGGDVNKLTTAEKARLDAIDAQITALQTNIDVRRLEAEVTNLQAEASDKNRVATQTELSQLEQAIGATGDLKRQRELYIDTLVPLELLQEIDALGRQRDILDRVTGSVRSGTSVIDTQISRLELQRRAQDLVVEGWWLQGEAMMGLPKLPDMAAMLRQFKELLILQIQQRAASLDPLKDTAQWQAIMGDLNRILSFRIPAIGAQHGFIGETTRPTVFMTSETGQREGVQVTPGGLRGGGGVVVQGPLFQVTGADLNDPATMERHGRRFLDWLRRNA